MAHIGNRMYVNESNDGRRTGLCYGTVRRIRTLHGDVFDNMYYVVCTSMIQYSVLGTKIKVYLGGDRFFYEKYVANIAVGSSG